MPVRIWFGHNEPEGRKKTKTHIWPRLSTSQKLSDKHSERAVTADSIASQAVATGSG